MGLAGRPGEGPASEKVHMEVGNGLPRRLSLIDDESVAVLNEAFRLGDLSGGVQKIKVVARLRDVGDARDLRPGNDEDVDGRLRVDVSKRDDVIIFVNNVGGNLPVDDFRKERHFGGSGCRS